VLVLQVRRVLLNEDRVLVRQFVRSVVRSLVLQVRRRLLNEDR
jgi:hypothetical protein